MKTIVAVCFAMLVLGLNAFGETNAVPATARSLTKPEAQSPKATVKPKTQEAAPAGNNMYHSSEVPPAQLAAFHRIDKQNLLKPSNNPRDMEAMMEEIFHPGNDVGGPTCIRGNLITIFPPGR